MLRVFAQVPRAIIRRDYNTEEKLLLPLQCQWKEASITTVQWEV